MPNTTAAALIHQIHNSGHPLVLAVAGGGSGAISELLQAPGASRTVLEAAVPYSQAALTAWLGAAPEQSCCDRTARAMAMAAWTKARRYSQAVGGDAAQLIGVACTASLASDRPKRGAHRAFLAVQTSSRTATQSVILEPGRRSRGEEEVVITAMILNMIAECCGIQERLDLPLTESEQLESAQCLAPAGWQALLLGQCDAVRLAAGGATVWNVGAASVEFAAIFPGAFNPLHHGHREMAERAAVRLNCPVEFEIAIQNVDKPPLDYLEIEQRVHQFSAAQTVWLTAAPTFVRKAQLFPGVTFVVGADTIVRIADPRYYAGDTAARDRAIEQLVAAGCRFLVFARSGGKGFSSLAEAELPGSLVQLCDEVPAEEFWVDVSSTELRKPG